MDNSGSENVTFGFWAKILEKERCVTQPQGGKLGQLRAQSTLGIL